MTIHVDDCRMTGPIPENMEWCRAEIAKRFDIKNTIDIKRYLGMKIQQIDEGITLSQGLYVQDLLREFGMEDCRPVTTPMDPEIQITINGDKDSKYDDEFTREFYQSGVDSAQYLAI